MLTTVASKTASVFQNAAHGGPGSMQEHAATSRGIAVMITAIQIADSTCRIGLPTPWYLDTDRRRMALGQIKVLQGARRCSKCCEVHGPAP